MHVIDVALVIFSAIVRMVHDGQRIVEPDFQSGLVTGIGQFSEYVAFEWRVGDLVAGQLAVEHAEAVMVFANKHQVFHAGVLGHLHPLVGIELDRVESLVEIVIDFHGHVSLAAPSSPFTTAGPTDGLSENTDRPPVNE